MGKKQPSRPKNRFALRESAQQPVRGRNPAILRGAVSAGKETL